MKEFRIARCLDDNGIHEYAIFVDGSKKKLIQTHNEYGKFFTVDNVLNTDEPNGFLRRSFTGRIKDAVDTIKNGGGDCIQNLYLFGKREQVVYFIDRNIGENLRQQTLEGWKDTKFGWAIECGNKNSFGGYSMLNARSERISFLDGDKTPMTFDSKNDAEKHIQGLIERAKYYTKRLVNNLHGVTDSKERDRIVDEVLNEIEQYTGTKFSVIDSFMSDMLTGDCENLKSSECNLDEWGYRVIQCIRS
jgi:hypothetical protein